MLSRRTLLDMPPQQADALVRTIPAMLAPEEAREAKRATGMVVKVVKGFLYGEAPKIEVYLP
jgi:hypothetical protein